MTAAEFRREHGDVSSWSDADWETYTHLAETDAWDTASEEDHRRWTDPAAPPPASWLHRTTTTDTTGGTR